MDFKDVNHNVFLVSEDKLKIIVHIGWPRSGTTAIQSFFFLNRDELIERGVIYPATGLQNFGHHQWVIDLFFEKLDWISSDTSWAQMKRNLLEEIDILKPKSIFISSEAFSSIDDLDLFYQRLSELDFDIEILAVVREHFDSINSSFIRQLSTKAVLFEPDKYISDTLQTGNFNYSEQIEKWEATINKKVHLVHFDDVKTGAIFGVIGRLLDVDLTDLIGKKEVEKNQSLPPSALKLLQDLPVDRLLGHKYASMRSTLLDFYKEHSEQEKYTLFNDCQKNRILEYFDLDRKRLGAYHNTNFNTEVKFVFKDFYISEHEYNSFVLYLWNRFGLWKGK
ncbi:hypothetical protein AB4274_14910 [Vibrio sp. 10N.261.55.A10]|uniref:hypothetical protein n=1 Tax=Vibrio sp. 10N.261.55.A10 TaxID=3229687 RepID=UPI003550B0C7